MNPNAQSELLLPAQIISKILRKLSQNVAPGVTPLNLEEIAAQELASSGAVSFNKGYSPVWAEAPYPAITCICRNHEVCHKYPDSVPFREGDIVSIDLGIIAPNGYCGDAALTVPVGKIDNRKSRLIYYARKTLEYAISLMWAGESTEFIARQISMFAGSRGFTVNKAFAGHRIGKEMHMKPNIYNSVESTHTYGTLEVGQVYCIEPMLTPGKDAFGARDVDGWTVYTRDKQPSAFFEHMVLITETGPEVLTSHIETAVV